MRILSIVLKNLRIILRSKSTVLLLILAPIILMTLIGLAYNTNDFFSDTEVGYFGDSDTFFQFEGIEFKSYGAGSAQDRNNCIIDMKRGELNLCMNLTTQKDDLGNILSAQIVYYKDNTQNTFSNILTNAFDRQLRKKTDEISSKSVSDILGEISETLKVINESRTALNDFLEVLIEAEQTLLDNEAQIKSSIRETRSSINSIQSTKNEVLGSLEDLSELQESNSISTSASSLNFIEGKLENIEDDFDDIENEIIDEIGFLPGSIDDEIGAIKDDIDSITAEISSAQFNLNRVQDNLASVDFKQSENALSDIYDNLEEISPQLNSLESDFDSFLETLTASKEELLLTKSQIDEKYDFFNELSQKDSSKIVKPISTQSQTLLVEFTRAHELSPAIITLVLLFVGLLLSNVIVSLEINSKAYFRNLISPVSQLEFILALFITSILIILFQLLFFFVILIFVFKITKILIFMPQILFVIFHGLLVFVLLGIFLSYIFASIQISILVTTFFILFLFLLSDVIIPLQLMPEVFAQIIELNPVVIIEEMFRELFFYGEYFTLEILDLLPIYIYSIVLTIGIYFANIYRKKKLF